MVRFCVFCVMRRTSVFREGLEISSVKLRALPKVEDKFISFPWNPNTAICIVPLALMGYG